MAAVVLNGFQSIGGMVGTVVWTIVAGWSNGWEGGLEWHQGINRVPRRDVPASLRGFLLASKPLAVVSTVGRSLLAERSVANRSGGLCQPNIEIIE